MLIFSLFDRIFLSTVDLSGKPWWDLATVVGTYSWHIYSTNPTTFGLTTDQVEGVGLFFLWSEMTYIKVISLDVTHTALLVGGKESGTET